MPRLQFRAWAFPLMNGGTKDCTVLRARAWPPCFRKPLVWLRLGTQTRTAHCRYYLHRSPRQIQRSPSAQQPSALSRPDVLVAKHQYLSRSALGPRRRRLAKIPISPQKWRWRSSTACKATIGNILKQ